MGRIVHRDTSYEGLHPALIDRSLWDAVQQRLADNVQGTRQRIRVSQPSLLAGRIVDEDGQALIASHACKGTQRYRYYIGTGGNAPDKRTIRIPARQIEQMVVDRLTALLADPIDTLAHHLDIAAGDYPAFLARAVALGGRITQRHYATIRDLVTQVRLAQGQVMLSIDTAALAGALRAAIADPSPLELVCEVRLTRSGRPVRLIRGGENKAGKPDPTIVQLLVRANRYWQILKAEPIDITRLAEREGVNPSYLTRILRLAFLAPDITQAMLMGARTLTATARQLTLSEAITADWAAQRRLMVSGT